MFSLLFAVLYLRIVSNRFPCVTSLTFRPSSKFPPSPLAINTNRAVSLASEYSSVSLIKFTAASKNLAISAFSFSVISPYERTSRLFAVIAATSRNSLFRV